MGIGIGKSSCKTSVYATPTCNTDPNPNPYIFTVVTENYYKPYLIAAVKYPNCTTYNGIKIMVFKDVTTIKNCVKLDPHFLGTTNGKYEPIARFPGDSKGAELAELFVKGLIKHGAE